VSKRHPAYKKAVPIITGGFLFEQKEKDIMGAAD